MGKKVQEKMSLQYERSIQNSKLRGVGKTRGPVYSFESAGRQSSQARKIFDEDVDARPDIGHSDDAVDQNEPDANSPHGVIADQMPSSFLKGLDAGQKSHSGAPGERSRRAGRGMPGPDLEVEDVGAGEGEGQPGDGDGADLEDARDAPEGLLGRAGESEIPPGDQDEGVADVEEEEGGEGAHRRLGPVRGMDAVDGARLGREERENEVQARGFE